LLYRHIYKYKYNFTVAATQQCLFGKVYNIGKLNLIWIGW